MKVWLLFFPLLFFLSGYATTAPDLLEKEPQKQYLIGARYYTGEGAALDRSQAMFWFHRAAEQGHAGAQRATGLFYVRGKGTETDYNTAFTWLSLAAEAGEPDAQHGLAILYIRLCPS